MWVQRRDGAVKGALWGDTLEGGTLGAGSEGREGRKGPGGLGVSALRALVQGGVVGRRRRGRAEVPVGAEGDQEGPGPRARRGGRGTCKGDAVSEPVPPKTLDLRPRHRRRSYHGPRPHVTRARAGGGAVTGPAPGVPSASAQRLPGGPGKRRAANDADADAEWPGGLGDVVIPHNRASPLLRGVQCFRNKHAPRGLGARGGRGSGAGLRAGAGLGASHGGVGG